MGHDHI